MLPKRNRLKNKKAFNATYKQKRILSDDNVCIYFGKDKHDTSAPTLFGFVVSKKIHKRAVVRNRIKRLMRENIRLLIKNNESPAVNKYVSVIFVGKQGAINANFENINSSLISLLHSAEKKIL